MPGAPPSSRTMRPESSAIAGSPLAATAASAFNAAFAPKLSPVSSGSAMPSAAAETVLMAKGARSAVISSTLPWLWLAMTSRSPMKRRAMASAKAERCALAPGELGDARPGELHHLGEEPIVEWNPLGRRLDLDDPARAGQHEIGVSFGLRILGIVEVEHRRPGDDPAGDRGNRVAQREARQKPGRYQPLAGLVQRHIAAGDRRGPGAAVSLQNVAIDPDLTFAEPGQIDDGPQAAPDQPLDLLGASALPATGRLAVGAGRRRARQHAVFGRHPALPGVAQKRRDPLLDRSGAQHMSVAEHRQARALGIFRDPGIESDRPHRIGGAP